MKLKFRGISLRSKELLAIVVMLIIAAGLLTSSYARAKENPAFDLLSKFAFAILVVVIARVVSMILSDDERLAAYRHFYDLGMRDVYYPLSISQVKERLESSTNIRVLKTWFPEYPDIEMGLEKALAKGASVQLLLLQPDSTLLGERSLSTKVDRDEGGKIVVDSLFKIYGWVRDKSKHTVSIGLYDSWPGCPVIWHNSTVLMGFYIVGKASPHWPWVEVRPGSELEKWLNDQFDSLWANSEKLVGRDGLRNWLEKRGKLPRSNESRESS